jgi:hypothetical protein
VLQHNRSICSVAADVSCNSEMFLHFGSRGVDDQSRQTTTSSHRKFVI